MDGGKTIENRSAELSQKLEIIGRLLNLKPHLVTTRDRTQSVLLHGPFDLEGHRGSDGRFCTF